MTLDNMSSCCILPLINHLIKTSSLTIFSFNSTSRENTRMRTPPPNKITPRKLMIPTKSFNNKTKRLYL